LVATSFGLEPPRAGEEPDTFAGDAVRRFDPTCFPDSFATTRGLQNRGLKPNAASGLLSKSEASALSSHHFEDAHLRPTERMFWDRLTMGAAKIGCGR
jgi:hypothetical protein